MAVFTSFDEFIASTNGQSIANGECWDYVNLLWQHLGSRYWTYPPSDSTATNHGVKWGVLNEEAKLANIINHISFISNLSEVKRGDVVITSEGTYGHAGFVNEDFNGSLSYSVYSQNYNNRRSVALDHYSLSSFVGAFRYDEWNSTPPTPPPSSSKKKKRFPWAIYGNSIRQKAINI